MTKREDAWLGARVADALAMPGHWYYDRAALRRDYGVLDHYTGPRNPHPDSILWRASYKASGPTADILRDQAQYWGQPGVHYHQFLEAGENTLNLKVAALLHDQVRRNEGYDRDAWLALYVDYMLTPGRHRDTYVEEYHRNFFSQYGDGVPPHRCSGADGHIGGLAAVPALFDAMKDDGIEPIRVAVRRHVGFSHGDSRVMMAADLLVQMLDDLHRGLAVRETIRVRASGWVEPELLDGWTKEPDEVVVGRLLSPACYIRDAFTASLYLCWKYADAFDEGIIANAMVGGDNCHRGVVVGSMLGLANGVAQRWHDGLRPPLQR